MNAPQERNVQSAGHKPIIGEHALPGQQAPVFDPLDPRPDTPWPQLNMSSLVQRTFPVVRASNAELSSEYAVRYCREMLALPARSMNFCTLPVAVFGSSSTKVTHCGVLKCARLCRTWSLRSPSVVFAPFRNMTKAWGDSPHLSCDMPTTATSCTAGWRSKHPSPSTEEMFSPPLIITSLKRSRISTKPSTWTTAASPEWNQPSLMAASVASGSL